MPDYNQIDIEKKWQQRWIDEKTFAFDIEAPGEVYAIDNPPSFTSGSLHLGHAMGHTWIDFIARYKRMRGYNVLFPLGYDCHGLPTELKVAKEYKISPANRKEFREKCEEYTTNAIAKMNEQYKRIGYSCDWNEYYETRAPWYKALVQKTLLDFNRMGRVYREKHPVMWCPRCQTALAKAEVGHIEQQGKLWYLAFPIKGSKDKVTIATTRPEMLFACVGIFVHPDDDRNAKLVGKKAIIPYVDREVEIRADSDVDMGFGTGVVYVCTFGDEMDIKWQDKYKLPVHIVFDETGRMTDVAGKFKGMKSKECLQALLAELKASGVLVKEEPYTHNVLSHTERSSCLAPVEFLPKHQFFIKVTDKLGAINEAADEMNWFPENLKVRMTDWTANLTWDWIISRQRVYGTPIPFWHCDKCDKLYEPAESALPIDTSSTQPPAEKCSCGGKVVGTTDTCDVWVDSSVTPLAVTKWNKDQRYFEKAYPCGLRPQGYEIIRTWAFYTTFRCLLLTGQKPFKNVVLNGMVGGEDGKKMSKSYGNIVAPDVVYNKEGADALRQWALSAPLGIDYAFSSKEIVYGAKFLKKYWNAAYFASQFLETVPKKPKSMRPADKWILHRLNSLMTRCTEALDKYEFEKALNPLREFFWHDFCDNYMEIAKDRIYSGSAEEQNAAKYCIYQVLMNSSLMFAPFIPHLTEEVHELYLRRFTDAKSIHKLEWPTADASAIDPALDALGNSMVEIVSAVRKYKSENKLPLNSELRELIVYKPELSDLSWDIKEATKAAKVSFASGKGPIAVLDFSVEVKR